MIKHLNGLCEDKGKHHHHFYKIVENTVCRYSNTLDSWILCLDESVSKQIKQLES